MGRGVVAGNATEKQETKRRQEVLITWKWV
jgi:hypothetical protein